MLALKNWWQKLKLQTRITIALIGGLSAALIFCSVIAYSVISNILYSNLLIQINDADPHLLGIPGLRMPTITMANPFVIAVSTPLMQALLKYLIVSTIFIVAVGGLISYFVTKRQLEKITETSQRQEDFVSDVAHELRTPLTVISGQVDLYKTKRTQKKKMPLQEIDKHIENIDLTAEQMRKLTEELLVLSRLDASEKAEAKNVNLLETIKDSLKSINDFHHTVQISVDGKIQDLKDSDADFSIEDIIIKGSEDQIRRVFINLFTNIEKYTPAKSPIEINIEKKQKTVSIQIADHGQGVDDKDLNSIYDRFFTTSSSRNSELSGTGLGLAIVQEIVKKQGGIIRASQTPGGGLTHKIVFHA
ncbi:MAG: HAMP domain-containing histidine kinase [Bifidobacteriaceae bacterium]|jgi:signal transduction histidine kinase|nr:HAMP domain-containing histidine kinase [Bifidobacteriaceae bacterium]